MGKGSDAAEGGVAIEDLMVTKLCIELTSSCLLNMLPTIDMPGPLRHPGEVGVPELGRPAAAAPESLEHDLHRRRRD